MDPSDVSAESSKDAEKRGRYTSLMTAERQASLSKASSRAVSAGSALSNLSMESTVSDFLEEKIQAHRSNLDYVRDYQSGLEEALASKKLDQVQYDQETERMRKWWAPIIEEHETLRRQRRTIEQDMEERYEEDKRRNTMAEPPLELMENAYASTMVARVMACAPQKKSKFNQVQFRKDVVAYLQASDTTEGSGRLWCHVHGWIKGTQVKAAHLVPKSLRGDELTALFGVGEVVLSDPRNGITLLSNLEQGLDKGIIVIVPIPPIPDSNATKWKCILVDEKSRFNTYYQFGETICRWNDVDGKELKFRSNNRPARRYLYFRYVMTYLHAKQAGDTAWAEKIEYRNVFWATPGPYLEISTLRSLARNISGCELPPPLYEGTTFQAPDENETQDLLLSSRLRSAIIESSKRTEEEDGETEEEEEEEEERTDTAENC